MLERLDRAASLTTEERRIDLIHVTSAVHNPTGRHLDTTTGHHLVELARRFADRIVGMSKGDVVFDGPPRALEDRHLIAIYGGEAWLN